MNSKAYLFVGPFFLKSFNGVGPTFFFSLLQAQVFYFLMEFNTLCHFGPWCNMVTFFLDLNNTQVSYSRVPLIKYPLFSNDHSGGLYPTLTSKNYYIELEVSRLEFFTCLRLKFSTLEFR